MSLLNKFIGVFAAMTLPATAIAATATGRMNVRIAILASCEVVSASDLDFGTVSTLAAAIDRTSTLTVKCSNTTPFNVGLSAGSNGGSVASRRMSAGGSEHVTYSLYRDAARTQLWGDTVGTDTHAATGNGSNQSFTVFGRVNTQNISAPGNYSDVVTVTITY